MTAGQPGGRRVGAVGEGGGGCQLSHVTPMGGALQDNSVG